jgi:predicted TIM-barrel fold metal-dependent hydrolase
MNHPRRRFLTGLAATGAAALFAGGRFRAQTVAGPKGPAPQSAPHRIDVHFHFSSPGFIAAIKARNTGQLVLMNWSPARTIEDMDRDGVATSIVSTSEPSVWFGDNEAARRLARECNEYGARLMSDYRGRFGMFATLPLPDVDGALREIEYAFDTLEADGACFMSSYQGKYLGDPAFAPVMNELNRRKAVVYTHPFRAECCVNLLPNGRAFGITLSTETTVTIASVLFSGTAARCPDIRFIWSHGGGTMPYITGRFGVNADAKTPELPNGVLYEIQKMYYDTAQAFNAYTLPTFTKLVPLSHMLFGTDYPFARAETVTQGLVAFGFSPAAQRAIERDNALELFPRLRSADI